LSLSENEFKRYSRQIVLKEIRLEGQKRLKNSRVSIIGIGGLGCYSSVQLASMGIGYLRLIDQDVVDITNLHRQILYDTESIGYPKVEIAQKRLKALNPNVEIDPLPLTINDETAHKAVEDVDVVIDGLDRFEPRRAINRACIKHEIPYIYGGALETYGNVSTIIPQKTACLECFTGTINDEGLPTCETAGVLPSILAVVTSVQVNETIHLLLGEEPILANKLLFADVYSLYFSTIDIIKRENCQTCGTPSSITKPTITEAKVVELCGKDSFMASPRTPLTLNLDEITPLLKKRFKMNLRSNFGLSFEHSKGITISLMKTGNALIKGLSDKRDAIKIYNELLNIVQNTSLPLTENN
jgi:molybdopterin/thiamine biosynthesis adenylyltransferase